MAFLQASGSDSDCELAGVIICIDDLAMVCDGSCGYESES
jgi:hypothetical protein